MSDRSKEQCSICGVAYVSGKQACKCNAGPLQALTSNRRSYWADIISRAQSGTFLTSAQCQEVAALLASEPQSTSSKEHLRWRKAAEDQPHPWVLEHVTNGEVMWTLLCAEKPLEVISPVETSGDLAKIVGDIHEAVGEDRDSDHATLPARIRQLLADLRNEISAQETTGHLVINGPTSPSTMLPCPPGVGDRPPEKATENPTDDDLISALSSVTMKVINQSAELDADAKRALYGNLRRLTRR